MLRPKPLSSKPSAPAAPRRRALGGRAPLAAARLRALLLRPAAQEARPDARLRALPGVARVYGGTVALAALAVALPLLARTETSRRDWLVFAALGAAAGLAQLFPVFTPGNQSYQTSIVFVLAGVLVLPVELALLLPIVQHIPEWLKIRYPWFIQTFNICNHSLDAVAAWLVARSLLDHAPGTAPQRWALAATGACTVYVVLNHVLLALMLRTAHGHTVRKTKLFTPENLSTELALASLGAVVAALWSVSAGLVLFALVPLVVMQRVFSIPQLEAAGRVDPKTGLFNSRHLSAALDQELSRALRFEHPLSLLMADLDLLREINNEHGHLAGDAVLRAVAGVLREQARDYDVTARFGGEEFVVLLPETEAVDARAVAERIRRGVEALQVEEPSVRGRLRATVSVGVASFPHDAGAPDELVRAADRALYRAKLEGRNRVCEARALPATLAS